MRGIVGNRDDPPEMSIVAARLDRAKNNMLEALPIFLALALLAMVTDHDSRAVRSAALVFLVARVVYVPAYLSGIPMFRSLVWLIGTVGLAMMAWPLVQS